MPILRRPRAAGAALVLCVTLAAGCAAAPGAGSSAPAPTPASATAATPATAGTLVLLVRHAEKAAVPGDDPPLSEAGTTRARALADSLRGVGVTAVIVSPRRRTAETAAPLAAARGLTPEVVPFGASPAEHVQAVAAAVRRHAGGVVLVVGHSNTVPAIVTALGGPRLPDLCDASYATLFTVRLAASSGAPTVSRSGYGTPDPAGADSCAGMQAR